MNDTIATIDMIDPINLINLIDRMTGCFVYLLYLHITWQCLLVGVSLDLALLDGQRGLVQLGPGHHQPHRVRRGRVSLQHRNNGGILLLEVFKHWNN